MGSGILITESEIPVRMFPGLNFQNMDNQDIVVKRKEYTHFTHGPEGIDWVFRVGPFEFPDKQIR
jgi:hypothetical protein